MFSALTSHAKAHKEAALKCNQDADKLFTETGAITKAPINPQTPGWQALLGVLEPLSRVF